MQFDHVGIPTSERKSGETYVAATRVWVTDAHRHPFQVEWLRYEPDSPVTARSASCRTWPSAWTTSVRSPS